MFKTDAAGLNLLDKATLGKSDEELSKITSEGLNKMPAFGTKLDEAEINAVVAYFRG